jgi:hypothetical protein
MILQRYFKRLPPFFVDGANFLQISQRIVQYPLPAAPEDNKYPLAKKSTNTIRGVFQTVAEYLYNKFDKRVATTI